MTRPVLTLTKTRFLAWVGIVWAWLTGLFFAMPTVSPAIGIIGITLALFYSWIICLFGKRAVWISVCLTMVIIIGFNIATGANFSLANYIVLYTISLNLIFFGLLGASLRGGMTLLRSWRITAGLFGGSLALGWLIGVICS